MIAEVKFGGWTKIAINSGGLKYLHANTYINHLDNEWDLCLEQGLGDHGWGALLKASAEKEKHFSLEQSNISKKCDFETLTYMRNLMFLYMSI